MTLDFQRRRLVTGHDLHPYTAIGADIAAKRVVMAEATEGGCKLTTGATVKPLGITHEAIAEYATGSVQVTNVAIGTSGEALSTAGLELMADSAGKLFAWTAHAGDNAYVVGTNINTTSGADEDVEVALNIYAKQKDD